MAGEGGEYNGDHLDFRAAEFKGTFIAQGNIREAAAAPTALDALPTRVSGFTGRGEELGRLLEALDPSVAGGGTEAVLVAALSGLGGIGKTALAVEAAHRACDRGWFQGGVLFLDLHGYDDDPVTAEQALEALLRALGAVPEHIPPRKDERAALYRSLLAERGRQRGAVLVLADNASAPAQVRPLLPGDARHRLLVTSRGKLPQLGGRLLTLGELPLDEAHELLDRALRTADPEDNRVTDDTEAAVLVAARCGQLPLALQVAAALLILDPNKPLAELAQELVEFRNRLDHLNDGERSVQAAFDLSYRGLPPEQARLLRLLAFAPGRDVSTDVVTALTGEPSPPLRALEALARAHLVTRGRSRDRWWLHDLVRAYGVGVVAADPRLVEEAEQARLRVLTYYHRTARAADARLRWLPGRPEPEGFEDRESALDWLDRERTGLVAAVQWAHEQRYADRAFRLAARLAAYLEWRRRYHDWVTVSRAAFEAAYRTGNPKAEASAWNNLGSAYRMAGRLEEAIDAHRSAQEHYQDLDERQGEANALNNLGIALRRKGRVDEAIAAHSRAQGIYRTTRNPQREGSAWTNLGIALRVAGRVDEAIAAHRRARDLYQAVQDRQREARAWQNLGVALREAGRAEESVEAYGKALEIHEDFEDWYRTGQCLRSLAHVYEETQGPGRALEYWLRAVDAFTVADAPAEAARALFAADRAGKARPPHPLTAPPKANPPPNRRATST
ncbi:tetratricopeptide repeat protein [Streptomyces justiciae]|uniref:tetratricopeptide repeat protein n=1 Tax=Streptomyces justiciae TaxID=2780140 RepID=UPI001882919C|nr:tetratricopeptide repeat protein [Streptomyces justiciae]MBE8472696.1 tetratricopeptide repeat protein [Streptomyces justiciae]